MGLTALDRVGDGDNSDWKSTAGLVEGTDAGAMACMVRGMAGLDPRRLRFHDLPVADAADFANLQRPACGCDRGARDHAVDAAGRRHGFGVAGRPGWAARN